MGLSSQPQQDPALQWQQQQLLREKKIAENQQADVIQQSLGQTSLDWLKQFGQVQAAKASGISAPFSTVAGGFQQPFVRTSGTPARGLR